jgi:hypothetical protein
MTNDQSAASSFLTALRLTARLALVACVLPRKEIGQQP